MATDVTSIDAGPTSAMPEPPQPAPRGVWPHRGRFLFIYGSLATVFAAAIAGVAVYAGRSISPGPSWSSWKPGGGGVGAAKQIADHVAKSYRLTNGNQLVDVIAKAPSVSPASTVTIPIHYIAVQGAKGAANKDYAISSSDSVMYSLCGLGTSCSIATGKATVERGTLVRREILELALYTFKYVDGVKNVIAFMPPAPGTQPQYVVYLQKPDVATQLHVPLIKTLSPKVPLPASIPPDEVHTVDAVTEPRVYKFSLAQAQTGDAILVLQPLSA
jgi:hypothetical protein